MTPTPITKLFSDGQLALLPFEAIRKPTGRYLVEDYLISYLSTGRNLLSQQADEKSQGSFVIFGDPDWAGFILHGDPAWRRDLAFRFGDPGMEPGRDEYSRGTREPDSVPVSVLIA